MSIDHAVWEAAELTCQKRPEQAKGHVAQEALSFNLLPLAPDRPSHLLLSRRASARRAQYAVILHTIQEEADPILRTEGQVKINIGGPGAHEHVQPEVKEAKARFRLSPTLQASGSA
ncbi:MAG: hypothetical protein D6690_02285 [Nitrospirae bacterium]|nr:MAG: hypothetical protein D6690_02285 [Nitrospirota bacterium]